MAADMAREALPIIEDPHKLEIVLSRRKQKYEELERMHQEAIRKHRSNPVLCSQCGAVLGTWQLLTRARTHKKCEMEKDIFCGTGLLVTQLFHVYNNSQLFNIYCGTMDEGSHSCAFAANICDDQNQELAILSCHSWKTGFVFVSGVSTLSPGLYRLDVSQANGPWTVQHLEY